jgi:hypothetical protein
LSATAFLTYLKLPSTTIDGDCSTNGEKRIVYRLLVGMLDGRGPLGRPRNRWVENIREDFA